MGAVAKVEDGKIVESTSAASLAHKSVKGTGNDSLDKDAFLQLLVAQMKYQDPLEPTSNTEYISQYATFSELEQMQNMSASMDLFRASSLVGQTVLLKVTDGSGRTTDVQGNVDYVHYEKNKAYLSINGELYSMDDLSTVADPTYLEAYKLAAEFLNDYNKLPALDKLSLSDKDRVEKLDKIYQEMTEYQKSFLSEEHGGTLAKYVERMKELVAIAGADKDDGTDQGQDGDKDPDEGGSDDDK